MATEKVGVYRKYHGTVPSDKSGNPLLKNEWPQYRPFSWAVRWFGSDGKRFSKSFKSRKEAARFAEKKQAQENLQQGIIARQIYRFWPGLSRRRDRRAQQLLYALLCITTCIDEFLQTARLLPGRLLWHGLIPGRSMILGWNRIMS